jgi:hypothetical protein
LYRSYERHCLKTLNQKGIPNGIPFLLYIKVAEVGLEAEGKKQFARLRFKARSFAYYNLFSLFMPILFYRLAKAGYNSHNLK